MEDLLVKRCLHLICCWAFFVIRRICDKLGTLNCLWYRFHCFVFGDVWLLTDQGMGSIRVAWHNVSSHSHSKPKYSGISIHEHLEIRFRLRYPMWVKSSLSKKRYFKISWIHDVSNSKFDKYNIFHIFSSYINTVRMLALCISIRSDSFFITATCTYIIYM